MAVPGDVANFDVATHPGIYNREPDATTLADPSMSHHPSTNPHRGDVPGKMKLIAEHTCGACLGLASREDIDVRSSTHVPR